MEAVEVFAENKNIFIILHVFSVIIGMGSALVSDILFNFYSQDRHLNETEKRTLQILSRTVWYSLIFIILSGVVIFFSNPETYIKSDKFISKMIVMLFLLGNGFVLHKVVQPHFNDKGILLFENKRSIRRIAFIGGAISVISWITVFILGSIQSIPLSILGFIYCYVLLLIVSSFIALGIEYMSFKKHTRIVPPPDMIQSSHE